MAHLWVGTSGWAYKHWAGLFYPEKTPAQALLPFYAQHFSTVEVNYSFYHLPGRSVFEEWRGRSPPGFVFAAKASQYLTHKKRLKDPAEPVQRLMAAAAGLGDKLGPILFQLPPRFGLNLARLDDLLRVLQAYPGQRWALEFRHRSWLNPDVFARLAQRDVALCLPVGWGIPLDARRTASWSYIRFHGGEPGPGFQDSELRPWADWIAGSLAADADVYAYFNNDPGGAALRDAATLLGMLGRPSGDCGRRV